MDTRQKCERIRANGRGAYSPRFSATPARSSLKFEKVHAACAFSLFLLTLPLSAFAADSAQPGQTITVVLDVAQKGALGALVFAGIAYLKNRRESRQAESEAQGKADGNRYATMEDIQECRGLCRKDISDLRDSISENDRQAEMRAKGTHARIDALYRETQKTTKSIGMLIGLMVGQGKAPASLVTAQTSED